MSGVLSNYDYDLPVELIAQHPCERREDARLLVVHRTTGLIKHRHVRDLPACLQSGDVLVFNNSKVIPARLFGIRSSTGGQWEGLYLSSRDDIAPTCCEFLAQTRGYLQPGEWIDLLDRHDMQSPYRLKVFGCTSDRHLLASIHPEISAIDLLSRIGHVPLPPYIRKGEDTDADLTRYQTVYAQSPGSIAAPTAGLHFSLELLDQLTSAGMLQAYVTLHVGIGTFVPIKVENLDEHQMHTEWCEVPADTAAALQSRTGRCIAIGTTTARALESLANTKGRHQPGQVATDLFIRPGFQFQAIDALLTNFHLPRSTLLVLVSTFAGHELIKRAYAEAIANRYRFFSYGDAMLIL